MVDPEAEAPELGGLVGRTVAFFPVMGFCFVLLGAIAEMVNLPVGLWFSEIALLFLPVILFLRANNLAPLRHLGLDKRLTVRVLLLVLFIAGANYAFAAGAMSYLDQVLPQSWHLVNVQKILVGIHGWRLALVLGAVVIVAPICEETAFRGLLQQPLVARLGPAWGIGITAVVFSAFHGDPIGFLPRVELGILFGWLYLRTGSLWASIAAHAVNNGTAAVLFLVAGGGKAAASATAPPSAMRTLVLLMVIGLALTIPALVAFGRRLPAGRTRPLHRLDPDRPVRFSLDSPEAIALAMIVVLTFVAIFAVAGGVIHLAIPHQ